MQRRTVLLISSDEVGWTDLRTALRALDVDVAGEATTTRQAIHRASTLRPDVILSAAWVEGVSAQPLLLDLQERVSPASKIIVFAGRLDPDLFAALDDLQIAGYLLWSDLSAETLPHLLATMIATDLVVGSREVAREFIATQCRPTWRQPGAPRLSEREQSVLHHLAAGFTRREIAAAEGTSVRTVERRIADLEAKLNAPNVFVLGIKAMQLGFLS